MSGDSDMRHSDQRRRWNVQGLERLAEELAVSDPARANERAFLVRYLAEFADADGLLPLDFDEVVRKSFGQELGVPALAPAVAATAAAAPAARNRFGTTKKLLVLASLAGIIAFVVGGSTFATFGAETVNPGSTFSSGTLTMSNTVQGGAQQPCSSNSSASQDNFNAACDAILTVTNAIPGTTGVQTKVTIADTGSIDASKFTVFASYVNGRIATGNAIANGSSVASIVVSSLEGPVTQGDSIVVSANGNSQTFCASANVAPSSGQTTIPIAASASGSHSYNATTNPYTCTHTTTAASAFPVGARVSDTSSDDLIPYTDCYDAKTTTAGVPGATKGTDLNFNSATNNPMCTTALLWIQEQSSYGGSTYNYCWFGRGSAFGDQSPSGEDSNGQCRTPTTMTLASSVGSGLASYSLSVGTLGGNIRSGDSITLSENGTTTTCAATTTYNIGYGGAISVNGCSTSGSATTFDSSAVVQDASAFSALNGSNTNSTVSSFDTLHNSGVANGAISLAPLTGNGTDNTNASVQLAKSGTAGGSGVAPATRVFYVGVYFPGGNASQNSLQGLMSTFGTTWHVDQ